MNRQEAKNILPIIQAFAEGKTVEYQNVHREWIEVKNPSFSEHYSEYRIKPEPKHRPFKNAEECWTEMQKHQPFGWLKHKEEKENYHILKIMDSRISMIDVCEEVTFFDYNETFKQYTFADGTPFGIKEE